MPNSSRPVSRLVVTLAVLLAAGSVTAQTAPASSDPAQATPPSMPGMGRHHAMRGEPGMYRERMMQWVDTDRDGQISRAELDTANQAMIAHRVAAFEAADANRDGKLSADEMRAFRQSMRPHGAPDGRRGPGPQGGSGNAPAGTYSGG